MNKTVLREKFKKLDNRDNFPYGCILKENNSFFVPTMIDYSSWMVFHNSGYFPNEGKWLNFDEVKFVKNPYFKELAVIPKKKEKKLISPKMLDEKEFKHVVVWTRDNFKPFHCQGIYSSPEKAYKELKKKYQKRKYTFEEFRHEHILETIGDTIEGYLWTAFLNQEKFINEKNEVKIDFNEKLKSIWNDIDFDYLKPYSFIMNDFAKAFKEITKELVKLWFKELKLKNKRKNYIYIDNTFSDINYWYLINKSNLHYGGSDVYKENV